VSNNKLFISKLSPKPKQKEAEMKRELTLSGIKEITNKMTEATLASCKIIRPFAMGLKEIGDISVKDCGKFLK